MSGENKYCDCGLIVARFNCNLQQIIVTLTGDGKCHMTLLIISLFS